MNMDAIFPNYLTNQNFFVFSLHLLLVYLIVYGQYYFYSIFFKRDTSKEIQLVESFLFIPFFLFPLSLLCYWIGLGNSFYAIWQLFLIFFAVKGLFHNFRSFDIQRLIHFPFIEKAIYLLILMFGYFSWSLPIPENFNGHAYVMLNTLTRMLETNSIYFIDKFGIHYDNAVFMWPQHFTFMLRTYCFPSDWIFYRPVFLLSVVVGFLIIQMLKDFCRTLNLPATIGFLGFLAIIGSYYNSLILFEIQYDTLSLLMLLYFLNFFAKMLVKREPRLTELIVILLIAFDIRRPVFVLMTFVMMAAGMFCFRRLKGLMRLRLPLVLATVFSVLVWSMIVYSRYSSPFYPIGYSPIENIFFKKKFYFNWDELSKYKEKLPFDWSSENRKSQTKAERHRAKYFFDLVQKIFPSFDRTVLGGHWGGLINFLIWAGPLSLFLFVIFLILLIRKRIQVDIAPFLLVATVFSIGYFIGFEAFFKAYRKYPQYLTAMTLIPCGIVLYVLSKPREDIVAIMLIVFIFLGFNIILFGHTNVNFGFQPLQIMAGRKSFIEKIAYKTNQSVDEVKKQIGELSLAYGSGKKILHMEHEPGALLPVLMGKEYLAESHYFESYFTLDIILVGTKEQLREAFERHKIGYVFIPYRSHLVMDHHPLILSLKKINQDSGYLLVVPIEEILQTIEYES